MLYLDKSKIIAAILSFRNILVFILMYFNILLNKKPELHLEFHFMLLFFFCLTTSQLTSHLIT